MLRDDTTGDGITGGHRVTSISRERICRTTPRLVSPNGAHAVIRMVSFGGKEGYHQLAARPSRAPRRRQKSPSVPMVSYHRRMSAGHHIHTSLPMVIECRCCQRRLVLSCRYRRRRVGTPARLFRRATATFQYRSSRHEWEGHSRTRR